MGCRPAQDGTADEAEGDEDQAEEAYGAAEQRASACPA